MKRLNVEPNEKTKYLMQVIGNKGMYEVTRAQTATAFASALFTAFALFS